MPDCRYYDATFEGGKGLADHLAAPHEWDELSGIDRKRIEVLSPEKLSEAEKESRPVETTDLDVLLETESTTEVIVRAIAEHERVVRQAERYGERGSVSELFREYYKPLATRLDGVVRVEGWSVLADLMDAYDPEGDADDSPASPIIGTAIGRYLVRTRLNDDVATLPTDGLDYLFALHDDEAEAWGRGGGWGGAGVDEAVACGWGIGHPSYPVADSLHTLAHDDVRWVTSVLEHAFYPEQHAAFDCLARIARDEEVPDKRFLLSCVHGHHRPKFPVSA